jgi:hypothetical protein
MTVRTPTYLKDKFENNDIPQQSDYGDIFDSFLPITATGKQTLDISLEIGGDFTASGNIYGGNIFTNVINAQQISASVANLNQINAQIISASTANLNKINAQIVSASTANLDRVNANMVSASGGEYNVINAQFISASSSNIKYPRRSVDASVAATGTTTAAAKSITEAMSYIKVSTSGSNEALIIGKSRPGFTQVIINDASASAALFPTSASRFNQQANGAAYQIPDRTTLTVYHITSAQYFTSRTSR